MTIHIITRCTRTRNLKRVQESVEDNETKINVVWHIVFDTSIIKDIDAELLFSLSNSKGIKLHYVKNTGWGLSSVNDLIQDITINDQNSWLYFLDDDNILHEKFYQRIEYYHKEYPDHKGLIFSQYVGGKDFTGLDVREASSENVKVQKIDLAQYILHADLFYNHDKTAMKLFSSGYRADGEFIEELYNGVARDSFVIIPEILCYYNHLKVESSARLPKILYIGPDEPDLKSSKEYSGFTQQLTIKYVKTDELIVSDIISFDPDCIITKSTDWRLLKNLSKLPSDVSRKWVNINPDESSEERIGQVAYECAMYYILREDNSDLISFFTPFYNTGEKLWYTYKSLRDQTHSNWEWVLVNDSTDEGRTLKIAEEIAASDHRVKVYDFREKSGGNIGESKYRAAMLSRGYLLAELDHDDVVVPELCEWLYNAATTHPDCGFFYTDFSTPTPQWQNRWFTGSFSFDYGSYRNEQYQGHTLKVVNQNNINPVTIRHIVGVPNHIRVWRRNTYLKLGGHRRRLSIADDYELVVRTFLETRMCHIPKLGYIQFMYQGSERNTHDIVRADIQRRVRSIAEFYHKDIKRRFDELGLHDWAYERDPNNPTTSWMSPWPKGVDEQSASIVWNG